MGAVKNDDEEFSIYRIMDFSRAVQIFENKELYFINPAAWEDPYEKNKAYKE